MATLRAPLIAAALLVTGCTEPGTITCQVSRSCGATQVQTCCTTGHCEYHVGQQTFPCNGTDCTLAAPMVNAICPPQCDEGGVGLDSGTLDASGCLR